MNLMTSKKWERSGILLLGWLLPVIGSGCGQSDAAQPEQPKAAADETPETATAAQPEQPKVAADETPATATASVSKNSMYLEEVAQPFFMVLSQTDVLGFTELYAGVQIVAWRHVYRDHREYRILVELGHGSKPGSGWARAMENMNQDEQASTRLFFGAFENFSAGQRFQLSAPKVEGLIEFVGRVEAINLKKTQEPVHTRFVQAAWRDFTLRKDDSGVSVWIPGDSGGWEPFPSARFIGALRKGMADLKQLEAAEPSADF